MARILILGAGGWGTALAILAASKGHEVSLWVRSETSADELRSSRVNQRHLPGVVIPGEISITNRLDPANAADYVFWTTPSTVLAEIAMRVSNSTTLRQDAVLVSCVKGLDHNRLLRMSQVLSHVFPQNPVAALSGPNHAEEVARFIPSATVIGSSSEAVAAHLQQILSTNAFRVYSSTDIAGIELGGALKNIFALAAGMCDGLGLGDNSKAALVTRSLAELTRLGTALGGKRETFQGLSGMGDLVVTCFSRYSRNRRVGERLARGESLSRIIDSMGTTAEGVPTTQSAWELAAKTDVETPIIHSVYSILYEKLPPSEAVNRLLTRGLRPEAD
ncbi:MAG: NAD(P)-dependent glycerol-3-phosphate dehydrogenase [Verrucomicrobia bacterium]|nr:NAD(P)-dependent glycerol-3-phosphate dehydrogenase [Verrucomicrobiota bacterium]